MQSPANNLTITLVQTEIAWQEASVNCEQIEKRLDDSENNLGKTDLIVLPEMFNSGFSMNAEKVAEQMDGPTVNWLMRIAAKHDAAVTGSLVIESNGENYNRMVFARPDGTVEFYDKRHLFRMADEHQRYGEGMNRKIVQWRGWRIGLYVCYDLRFPVWCRNQNDTDLMLFVASWPAIRRNPWQLLLQARAMENLCYVCGVNRIGTDGNDIAHCGDSSIIDMVGERQLYLADQNTMEQYELDAQALAGFREKFPAWMDADKFEIKLT